MTSVTITKDERDPACYDVDIDGVKSMLVACDGILSGEIHWDAHGQRTTFKMQSWRENNCANLHTFLVNFVETSREPRYGVTYIEG